MTPRYQITLTKTYHYRDDNNYPASSDSDHTCYASTLEGLYGAVAEWLAQETPHPEDADTNSYSYTTLKVGRVRKIVEDFEADMAAIHAHPAYIAFQAAREAELAEDARLEAEANARDAARAEEAEKAKLAELIAKHGVPDAVVRP